MMTQNLKINERSRRRSGQSAIELAIFGSILIFIVAMIFRQGLSGGNFMNSQLKATRYAMSKSFEESVSADPKPARNSGSVLIIEDRLSGDFISKFGTRDRVPMVSGGGGSYSNQLFYPTDKSDFGDLSVLPRQDVWINGQKFPFITSNFREYNIPQDRGTLELCTTPHPNDSRCWKEGCFVDGGGNPQGCVVLHRKAENNLKAYNAAAGDAAFDPKFDGNFVPGAKRAKILPGLGQPLAFMWHWEAVDAMGILEENTLLDVDGDFYEEQVLESFEHPATGRTTSVRVIDRQEGDIDFTVDGRRPGVKIGLLDDATMYSFTKDGTYYRVEEGKLFNPRTDQYIRNTNRNDHIDIVQRTFQLSRNTERFCTAAGVRQPLVDGRPNPVEICNNCFASPQETCLELDSLRLFVRSRIVNKAGRSWITRTEVMP